MTHAGTMPKIEPGLLLPDLNRISIAGAAIGILPKIESADSVGHLSDILDAADGAMVARGDLGAELPVQEVSTSTAAPKMHVGFIHHPPLTPPSSSCCTL